MDNRVEFTDALSPVLIAGAVEGIFAVDSHGLILSFNPSCERLFGYAGGEIVGRNAVMLMPAAEHVDIRSGAAIFSRFKPPAVGPSREIVGRRKDHSTFPMCLSVGEGVSEGNSIFVCVVHELTNRELDDTVRAREKRLSSILDVVPDALVIIDEAGEVHWFSAAAATLFGYTADDVVGKNVSMLMPSPYRAPAPGKSPPEQVVAAKGRIVMGQRRDGGKFPMEIAIGEILDGPKRHFSIFLRDLSKQQGSEQRIVDLQAELLHVSRLSSMGQMTAAIAHELNQPLTAIASYVMAAKRALLRAGIELPVLARAVSNIDKASAQALRAAKIIKNLRDFVEKRARDKLPVEIGAVFAEAVALAFVGSSEKQIKVELEVDPALAPVMIDKIQIQQVLVNLIRNAVEAMRPCEKRELHLTAAPGAAGFVDVTVRDTGPGMAARVSERLFHPFVTTKDSGMGIGLSICQSVIDAHGGRIWLLESGPAGTAFRFQLPLAERERAVA